MNIFEQLAEIKVEEARETALNEGKEELRKKEEHMVKSLLRDTEFSMDKIASLAGVSVSFVEQVKKELEESGKK